MGWMVPALNVRIMTNICLTDVGVSRKCVGNIKQIKLHVKYDGGTDEDD